MQTQPYCDWTLQLTAVTLVGIYSNVPSGGSLEQSQIDWLTGELKDAPADRPLIVALHHPPYSIDAMHGGSQKMGEALDGACNASGRIPELVLSGHVHDYQRFTRTINGRQLPYVVIGNSGYHNLHQLAEGAEPGEQITSEVTFEFGDDQHWGFLELAVDGMTLEGTYTAVTKDGQATAGADTFTAGGR